MTKLLGQLENETKEQMIEIEMGEAGVKGLPGPRWTLGKKDPGDGR